MGNVSVPGVPPIAYYKRERIKIYSLIDVKGIGSGTAKNLAKNGVNSVDGLLKSDPEQLATKISGISSKMINEWQANAKTLLGA